MRKHRWGLVPAMLLALALSACAGRDNDASASGSKQDVTIGALTLFPSPFFTDFQNGMKDAAAAADGKVEVLFNDVNSDVAKESEFIQNYVTRNVDALVMSPVSTTGSKASMQSAIGAGVPIICFNTCLAEGDNEKMAKGFVTSDQNALGTSTGEAAATYIKEELGGKAVVGMLTCETFEACKVRRAGLDEALSGVDVRLADAQEGFAVDKAVPVAESMLTAHKDINVLIIENEDGIVAAATAVKNAGLTGKVAIFGIGIDARIAKLVRDGDVRFTTGQDPYEMGKISVEMALKAIRGEDVDPFMEYAAAPTYTSDDPAKAEEYLASHPG